MNRRGRTLLLIYLCAILFLALVSLNYLTSDKWLKTNLKHRNRPPSTTYLFGTDWLGRDMFTRVIKGLNLSLKVGLIASIISAILALILGLASGLWGGLVDDAIVWLIDLFMSLPHLVFLILISFAFGGGAKGVVIGVAATHWTSLTRVIRAEVMQLMSADYIKISSKLGKSNIWIARHHLTPHLVPQFLVGLILLFPHAILHEAAISFIGVGLSPNEPAIGIILSESLRYLSTGYWWLAVIPGVCLLFTTKLFDILGENIKDLVNPKTTQG